MCWHTVKQGMAIVMNDRSKIYPKDEVEDTLEDRLTVRRMTEKELELMHLLWQGQRAMSNRELQQLMKEPKKAITTVATVLARMEDKGLVKSRKEGRTKYYQPLIEKEIYAYQEGKWLLEKFYDNSLLQFVKKMIKNKQII